MKLSTKGRYATRAMLDLALHSNRAPVVIKDIYQRQEISEPYLKQLLITLKVAGLVRAIRGAHGGFTLARPASEIKLLAIIQSVEGSTAPVECVDNPVICSRSNSCVSRQVWVEMKKAMDRVLESTTLQDLVEQQKDKEEGFDRLPESCGMTRLTGRHSCRGGQASG